MARAPAASAIQRSLAEELRDAEAQGPSSATAATGEGAGTGAFGGAVALALIERGAAIRVFSRDADKARRRLGYVADIVEGVTRVLARPPARADATPYRRCK